MATPIIVDREARRQEAAARRREARRYRYRSQNPAPKMLGRGTTAAVAEALGLRERDVAAALERVEGA